MPADVGCTFGALPRTPGFSRHGGHLSVAPRRRPEYGCYLGTPGRKTFTRELTENRPLTLVDPKASPRPTDRCGTPQRPAPAIPRRVAPLQSPPPFHQACQRPGRPSFLGQLRNEGRVTPPGPTTPKPSCRPPSARRRTRSSPASRVRASTTAKMVNRPLRLRDFEGPLREAPSRCPASRGPSSPPRRRRRAWSPSPSS